MNHRDKATDYKRSTPLFEAWGEDQLARLPRLLAAATKSKADYIFEQSQDRYKANMAIRAVSKVCAEKTLPVSLAASNSEILAACERLSESAFDIYARLGLDRAIEYAHRLAPDALDPLLEDDDFDRELILARITTPRWWRAHIRRQVRQIRERAWTQAHPLAIEYASPDAVSEYKSMLEATDAWARAHEIVSDQLDDDGHEIKVNAPTPAETAERTAARLTAVAAGIDRLASDAGLVPFLITITLPSEYHPTTTAGGMKRRANPKFDPEMTPKVGHAALRDAWSKTTRRLKNREIQTFWMIGVQPHKDGSMHWHVTMWARQAHRQYIEDTVMKYFGEVHNGTPHPDAIRFDDLGKKGGGLTGAQYAIRSIQYITRAIAAGQDENSPDAREALATGAWASTWGIRRFRTSHTAATLWKLCRRVDVEAPDWLKEPAAQGDFATFYRNVHAVGAHIIYTVKQGLWAPYNKPIGLGWANTKTGELTLFEQTATWTLRKLETSTGAAFAENAELILKAKGVVADPVFDLLEALRDGAYHQAHSDDDGEHLEYYDLPDLATL